MKFSRLLLLILTSLFLVTACSFAPENDLLSERPADFPDMRLEKSRYLLGLEGLEPIQINAETIELYRKAQKAFITDAVFTQNDSNQQIVFSGNFGFAVIDTATNNLSMDGGARIENHQDRFTIVADQLTWDNQERTVTGEPDTLVKVTIREHDILEGTGFSGDLSTATFEFLQMKRGRLNYE